MPTRSFFGPIIASDQVETKFGGGYRFHFANHTTAQAEIAYDNCTFHTENDNEAIIPSKVSEILLKASVTKSFETLLLGGADSAVRLPAGRIGFGAEYVLRGRVTDTGEFKRGETGKSTGYGMELEYALITDGDNALTGGWMLGAWGRVRSRRYVFEGAAAPTGLPEGTQYSPFQTEFGLLVGKTYAF
jgi:hypothetical protein